MADFAIVRKLMMEEDVIFAKLVISIFHLACNVNAIKKEPPKKFAAEKQAFVVAKQMQMVNDVNIVLQVIMMINYRISAYASLPYKSILLLVRFIN